MPLNIIVTSAGRAALINAVNTGTAPMEVTQVGLSQTFTGPAAGITALPGEFKRLSGLSGEVVAADTIHVAAFDDSADTYSLRSFALYLQDGTLFAIYGQADPILVKTSESVGALVNDIVFADISAATLIFGDTVFSNPPATTDRRGVVELATVAEAQAGIDALRALTPASAKAAVLGWLLASDGSGSGLDADTLDGQHGAYYADVASRLGYTPANRAGDVFTGNVTVQADFKTYRTGGLIGIVHLNQAGTRYLLNNGSAYELPAQQLYVAGAVSWNAGNDGSGSGLDADLLDGQHGSFYMTAASYTAADVLAKLVTVDGSGSGLDADLLDGQNGAYYADTAGRLGYTPANRAGDTFTGDVTVQADLKTYRAGGSIGILVLNQAGTRYLLNNGSAYELPGQQLYVAGALSWNAGNDGSGSGLDADLLDGLNATAFMRTAEPLEVRFGQIAHADNTGFQRVTFSPPFTSGLKNAVVCNVAASAPVAFHAVGVGDRFGIDVYSSNSSGLAALAGTAFSYIAIGF
jgi:hypothetical protein